MTRWRWTGVSVVALAGAALLWWLLPPARPAQVEIASAPPPAPEVVDAVHGGTPARVAPPREPVAEPGSVQAHATIANELGYVATRCWVGPEWDTDDLVGAFHQTIVDGWYSHVETSLTGRRLVERRYTDPDADDDTPWTDRVDFEGLFWVSWTATEPGQTVPCTVEFPTYGALDVTVMGEDGAPLDGVQVWGCGAEGVTDQGVVRLDGVRAGHDCDLRAFCRSARLCQGRVAVSALEEHEARAVTVEVWVHRREDGPQALLERVEGRERYTPPPPDPLELSREEELEVLRRLATQDLPQDTADLVARLVERREASLDRSQAREAIRDEMQSLTDELREATPQRRQEIMDRLEELREERSLLR